MGGTKKYPSFKLESSFAGGERVTKEGKENPVKFKLVGSYMNSNLNALPSVQLKIEGLQVTALVDTGAQVSIKEANHLGARF